MKGRTWTTAEVFSFRRMHRSGMSNWQIASSLGRSYKSIAAKAEDLGLRRQKRVRFVPPAPPVIVSRISIPHCDVPRWYEAGWRFIGFDSALCIFEWRSFGKPRWPADRELEAA